MYTMVGQSLCANGILSEHCDQVVDRGDGILALIRSDVPKTWLLRAVMVDLVELIAKRNAQQGDQVPLRMRAVLHAGEVHHDSRGCFGEDVDVACRLLDAPVAKQALRESAATLVLVVSDGFYRSIIEHGYPGIDQAAFRHRGYVLVRGRRHRIWVCLPGA
jgi:hypothetical protein